MIVTRYRDHLIRLLVRVAQIYFGIDCDAINGGLDIRRGEDELPSIIVFDAVASNVVGIGDCNTIVVCFDDLNFDLILDWI